MQFDSGEDSCCLVAAVVVTVMIEILNKFTRIFVDTKLKPSFVITGKLDVPVGE